MCSKCLLLIGTVVAALYPVVTQGVTVDTKYSITELRPLPPGSDNAVFYEAFLLENGDVMARDSEKDDLYRWVADSPHASSGQLQSIPWPVQGTFFNQGYMDVTDSGRAILYMQAENDTQEFLWNPTGGPAGQYTPMSTLIDANNASMQALNDVGQFGGSARANANDSYHPAIIEFDSSGIAHTTYLAQTMSNSMVRQINDAGQATVVRAFPTTSTYASYLWIPQHGDQPEVFMPLLAPQSSVFTRAMNDLGWIVGDATGTNSSNGYLWRPSPDNSNLTRTVLFQFGQTNQSTRVWDINDQGVAVGSGYNGHVAAIWSEATGDLNLNDMILMDGERTIYLSGATSINNYGQILAQAVISDPALPNGYHEYETTLLLTPVPEPAALWMLLVLIVAGGSIGCRRMKK